MPFEQLLSLASLGGFIFSAVILAVGIWVLFSAWTNGKLVSRPVHEEIVKQLRDENASLRQDNRDSTRELARLADAFENLAGRRR